MSVKKLTRDLSDYLRSFLWTGFGSRNRRKDFDEEDIGRDSTSFESGKLTNPVLKPW